MRLLQDAGLSDAGLSVSTTKRLSREVPASPASPSSPTPEMSTRGLKRTSAQGLGISAPTISASISASSSQSVTLTPVHTFVSPSTLSPPSPTSSTSSSPQVSHYSLQDFAQAFPSI